MLPPPEPQTRFADLVPHAGSPLFRLLDESRVDFVFNARAALFQLGRALAEPRRDRVLLPAYHCPTVVEPFIRAGLKPSYYRIDRRLQVDPEDLVARLSADVRAVVFINYFGFPSNFEAMLPTLRQRDIFVIEDCAHSFILADPIALAGRRADASVYSFWKLLPSHLGGGLWVREPDRFGPLKLGRPPLRDSAVLAKRLFEEAIMGLEPDSLLRRAYARAEAARLRWRRRRTRPGPGDAADAAVRDEQRDQGQHLAAQIAYEHFFSERLAVSRPPSLTRLVMGAADLQRVANARRDNFQALSEGLGEAERLRSVQRELPARTCPWAYPVLLEERDRHDLRLRERGVPVWTFGPRLHRSLMELRPDGAIKDALYLADRILCLPVHQQLRTADMTSFASVINDYISTEARNAA